ALDTPVAAVSAALVEALGRDVLIESRIIGEQDWAEAWIAHHPPLYFGGRLWVAPHGADVDTPGGDDVIIRLNPGLAFGTGTHPTTALCLAWLAHADLAGQTV